MTDSTLYNPQELRKKILEILRLDPSMDLGIGLKADIDKLVSLISSYTKQAQISALRELALNGHYTSGAKSVDYVPLFRIEDKIAALEQGAK